MSANGTDSAVPTGTTRSGLITRALRSREGILGLCFLGPVLLLSFVGPFVVRTDPNAFVSTPFGGPTGGLIFGADALGRDVFARCVWGGWELILLAAAATTFGVVAGAVVGITAAYLRGWRDNLIMRIVDIMLAFPQIVFALLLVSVLGSSKWLLVLAVGIANLPGTARVLRSTALDVVERDFVLAARSTKASTARILFREVLPNSLTPLMVEAGLKMTYAIVIMAGLSFLGFGLPPNEPNWGVMVNENLVGVIQNPWAIIVPCTLLGLLSVGVNTLTDAISNAALTAAGASNVILGKR